jgi:hypothetical protein
VGSALLGPHDRPYSASLDPRNPGGSGAQALARVLSDQDVSVDVVRSADALDDSLRSGATDQTTVVVTSAGNLGRSTTRRLLADQDDARLVVVAPPPRLVTQLSVDSAPRTTSPGGPIAAGCPAYDGLSLRVDTADAYLTDGCFRGSGGVLLAEPRAGLDLLGAPAALTNDQILDGDNAAVALRLLGQRQRLVWYVPSLTDLRGADSVSIGTLLPDGLVPGLWLLLVVALAVILWRARRLGPLAQEPLPVSVKAVETTRNLGRLYRRAGDRRHAAEVLRAAARARLAQRLHLPRTVHPPRLAAEVAARTGRPVAEVAALLDPHAFPPGDDQELAALARRLTELDREVSHR